MNKKRAAKTPDRYECYELAAQSPDMQARFLRALHTAPHETPLVFGEDFCGAGAVTRAFLSLHETATAVCVDADTEPLQRLGAESDQSTLDRLTIRHCDVRHALDPVDILAVLNFSICEIHHRADLVAYLRHARSRIRPGGVLIIDIYAGADAFITGESDAEVRGGLRYVWEQREANPLTGRVINAMHFYPKNAEPLEDAFVYDWRLWSVPELRDALTEAGFAHTDCYDRLGDAVDDEGRVYVAPVEDPDELEDNFVLYIAARLEPHHGSPE
ncbi:MAG: class I SAM-dependent methyltransferase [Planctomycetota bacterium]|nr:class I SAM-dependent methyltransferase [Planctomycetota bacterium]